MIVFFDWLDVDVYSNRQATKHIKVEGAGDYTLLFEDIPYIDRDGDMFMRGRYEVSLRDNVFTFTPTTETDNALWFDDFISDVELTKANIEIKNHVAVIHNIKNKFYILGALSFGEDIIISNKTREIKISVTSEGVSSDYVDVDYDIVRENELRMKAISTVLKEAEVKKKIDDLVREYKK